MKFKINCYRDEALFDVIDKITLSKEVEWLAYMQYGFKEFIEDCLTRYVQGDFGNVRQEDRDLNYAVFYEKIPGFTYSEYDLDDISLIISTANFYVYGCEEHTSIYLKEELSWYS